VKDKTTKTEFQRTYDDDDVPHNNVVVLSNGVSPCKDDGAVLSLREEDDHIPKKKNSIPGI